jgi:hypothetical protein
MKSSKEEYLTLEITAEAHASIRGAAMSDRPFQQTAQRLFNGNYLVPLSADTIDRLRKFALVGESISDTIIRLVAVKTQGVQ